MLALRDNLVESFDSLRTHKLRTILTLLGLVMGVATLITVPSCRRAGREELAWPPDPTNSAAA
jgi:hypothetical protein